MKKTVRILPTGRKEVTITQVVEAPGNGFKREPIDLKPREIVIGNRRFTGREEKSSRKFPAKTDLAEE